VRVPRDRIAEAGGDVMGQPAYFGVYLDVPPITEVVVKAKRILGFQPTPFERDSRKPTAGTAATSKKSKIDYSFEDRLIEVAATAPAAVELKVAAGESCARIALRAMATGAASRECASLTPTLTRD
jgi:hypothetical protein